MKSLGRMIFPAALALALAARAQIPVGTRYVPPKIIEGDKAVFPAGLHSQGYSSGEADLSVEVDSTGKLSDVLVVAYTRKAFADSAVEALKTYRFEPAYVDGRPVGWIKTLTFHFATQGIAIISTDAIEYEGTIKFELGRQSQFEYRPSALSELDRIPAPLRVVHPASAPSAGDVDIAFYVDETGRVRMPALLSGPPSPFAESALEAVAQWQFEPPTRGGKPTLVRATQRFHLVPPKPGGASSP